MDTAAAQLRRILQLIPHFADDKPHSFESIAERLGTDVETVRRDVRSLVERFDPGGFVEGVQAYVESDRVSLISNHFLRPMRLTSTELQALELGLAMLRTERPPDEHPVIDRARARLREALVKLPPDSMPKLLSHATFGANGSTEHLAAIRTSLTGRRKLRLSYRRGGAEQPGARTVCPYALVSASGMLYVIAHCEGSSGIRIFRLDRIEEEQALADRYEVPAGFSLDEIVRDGKVFHAEQPPRLRVQYSPRIARWIAEREGLTLEADGSLTAEYPLADVQWAVRHVLQYGPDAEVLSPPDVREEVIRQLDAASRAVDEATLA